MELTVRSSKKPTVEEIRDQFETWRKTREKRTPIPDALWEAAVSLSHRYSPYQTSPSSLESPPAIDPAFIELGLKDPLLPAECIVEMEDQNGAKMKMWFKGEAGLDLLELGKVFWSKRS